MLRHCGKNLWVVGRASEAIDALAASMDRAPVYDTRLDLITAYALAGPPRNQSSPEVCARTRGLTQDKAQILELMLACYAASPHEGDVPDKLP